MELKSITLGIFLCAVAQLSTGFKLDPLANQIGDDEWDKPQFCRKLECPEYSVVERVKGKYELRSYPTAFWVSTDIYDIDMKDAGNDAFHLLFDYISGQNVDGVKIEMTAPVINHVIPGDGPVCENNFTYSFYVPSKYQESGPPAPSADNVYVSTLGTHTAYVRQFPGRFTKAKDWVEQADILVDDLTTDGLIDQVEQTFFYTAGYDSPFQIFSRHNEIWFFVKDSGSVGSNHIGMSLPEPKLFPKKSMVSKVPEFCKKLDCPEYTVVSKEAKGKYELRHYSSAHWVSTDINGIDMKEASSEAFMRLFEYIQGDNVDGVKIDMTVPVINHVLPGAGPVCENTFTYSFFVPFLYQESGPPEPTADNVYLSMIEGHSAYVRGFPGKLKTDEEWVEQAQILVDDLTKDDLIDQVDQSFFYTAGYDSPFEIFKRHNEIWFFVKETENGSGDLNDNKLRWVN